MLCQFRFKNYLSYRDEAIFDMQAANLDEFKDTLLPPPCNNFSSLLPVSVIFGPNGGGKSNALNALAYLISRVMLPISSSTDQSNPFGMYLRRFEPFLLDDTSKTEPTDFEITFRTETAQFHYQLSLFSDTVAEETLSCIRTPCKRRHVTYLFERNGSDIKLGSVLKKANTQNVSASIPYLSFLAINYSFPEVQDAIAWFKNCFVINFAVSGRDHRLYLTIDHPTLKTGLLSMLSDLDIPISDYEIQEETSDNGEPKYKILTTHTVDGKKFQLNISGESEGTIKLLSVLPNILITLLSGGFLLVDELDAKLHPQILRYLISLYMDPSVNQNHAQLVFTCHDISIMKNDLFRRDEIWFAAQDEDEASDLWSLYDLQDLNGYKVKNTAAYDRQYLAGRYGADPYLKKMMDWREQNAQET